MRPTITPAARDAARILAELFARDQEFARALNAAHARLLAANERLTTGLSCDPALLAVYGPTGADRSLSGPGPRANSHEDPAAALDGVARDIRTAHHDYMRTADDRRVLAADIGQAAAELSAAMVAAGYTRADARNADVRALSTGTFRRRASR